MPQAYKGIQPRLSPFSGRSIKENVSWKIKFFELTTQKNHKNKTWFFEIITGNHGCQR